MLRACQPHVSALDTLTGQNADRSQVLRQADCQDDAGEFLGALDAEHLDCGLRYGVHFGGPRRPRPTGMGSSRVPTMFPSAFFSKCESDE